MSGICNIDLDKNKLIYVTGNSLYDLNKKIINVVLQTNGPNKTSSIILIGGISLHTVTDSSYRMSQLVLVNGN
jgi:hypothetical protein